MRDRHHFLILTSAAALTLALNQSVLAADGETTSAEAAPAVAEPTAPAAEQAVSTNAQEAPPAAAETLEPVAAAASAAPAEAPAATAPVAATETAVPPTPAEAARQRSDQRQADVMAKRGLRYEELRQRAAEAGVELPETPPWEQVTAPEMPAFPTMPSDGRGKAMMSEEERAAHIEKMRNMTAEDRMAAREAHWAAMRERAAERGIELPETPPWKAAMERRMAMQEKWDAYRKTVEEMTDEQREAAEAMFGQSPPIGGPAAFAGESYPGGGPGAEGPGGYGPGGFGPGDYGPAGSGPGGFGPGGYGPAGSGPSRFGPGGFGPAGSGPGRFGRPAMPAGGYGPCGNMPCQRYPDRDMGPRPPMMYPRGVPGGAQAPRRPMGGGY